MTDEDFNSRECPDAPDWMSFEAKLEWLRSAPKLFSQGRLEGGLIGLLENYCVAIGLARDMNAIVCADGNFISNRPHPAIKVMMEAMKDAKTVAGEIKFELAPPPPAPEDEAITLQKATIAAGWDPALLN
jgi:phage terminase small subunit